jgi:hypothetical protein
MIDDPVTDEALLSAARHDPEAFTQFYRRHSAPVLGYLVRRIGDPELGAGHRTAPGHPSGRAPDRR